MTKQSKRMPDGVYVGYTTTKDGIDEIIAQDAYVHLEAMSDNSYWMCVNETHIWINSAAPILVTATDSERRIKDVPTLREQLAAMEHEQWACWTKHMLDNFSPENVERWKRQIDTPYEQLSEKEKDSDREWADKILQVFVVPEVE